MNQALRKEPQVAITHYITGFMFPFPKSIFIPQRVTVSAVVTDFDRELPAFYSTSLGENAQRSDYINPSQSYIDLGIVYELIPGIKEYPQKTFQIPILKNKNNILFLMTEITVFEDIVLTEGNCSLTLPYRYSFLHQLPPAEDNRYLAYYEISSLPGIRIKPSIGDW
jgi:hypothetical protein